MEPKAGNSLRHGPKVVEVKGVAIEQAVQSVLSWAEQNE